MKKKTTDLLPKTLSGVVLSQMVRCGRPNCRCAGGLLHGPYFYRFIREQGKLKKVYVRLAELEQVQAQCEARRKSRRDLREALESWQDLRDRVRDLEKLL